MIEKYYDEELRYLYESGREFARAHPDRAAFLNADSINDRDPYVERLFEGFAFLAGRIREKLDDSFPELTDSLVNLLWPHFRRVMPSMTIIECKPRTGHLQEMRILPRGSELSAFLTKPGAVSCKFCTTSNVCINPISLVAINQSVTTKGNASLRLTFEIDRGIKWQKLSFKPLRLYLHAEPSVALALRELLLNHISGAELLFHDPETTIPIDSPILSSPGGFLPEDSLAPPDSRVFYGQELLLDYFACPEKFFFVDLGGFDSTIAPDIPSRQFSLQYAFNCGFPVDHTCTVDNFRLHCTPAVNLFKHDTEPIAHNGRLAEYRIKVDSGSESFDLHSIISVSGINRKNGERHQYEPFHTLKKNGANKGRTYTDRFHYGPNNKRELLISVNESHEEDLPGEENLSIEAWCTNGTIPREELREGTITEGGRDTPDYLMFSNITRPSPPLDPPPGEEYLWLFLSHLSATYSSFAPAENLKPFLSLYNWSHDRSQSVKIDSIVKVEIRPVDSIFERSIIRGIQFVVSLREEGFSGIGDLFLFGQIMNEFLRQYVSINSFLELTFNLFPSGKELVWNSLRGKKCPL